MYIECDECNGAGKWYNKNSSNTQLIICKKCDGAGKLKRKITIFEYIIFKCLRKIKERETYVFI